MPLITVKAIEGVFNSAKKQEVIRKLTDTMVAIVSVGSPRALLLRPRLGGPTRRFDLGHGDLIVMGGSCQRTWEHAIPKTARPTGPRISIQFRPRDVR